MSLGLPALAPASMSGALGVPCTLQTVGQGPLLLQLQKGKSSPSKGSWGWKGCDSSQCPLRVLITVGEIPAIRAHSDPLGKGWRGETSSGRCQWDTGNTVTRS